MRPIALFSSLFLLSHCTMVLNVDEGAIAASQIESKVSLLQLSSSPANVTVECKDSTYLIGASLSEDVNTVPSWANCQNQSSTLTLTLESQGVHEFHLWAKHSVSGRINKSPKTLKINYDLEAPSTASFEYTQEELYFRSQQQLSVVVTGEDLLSYKAIPVNGDSCPSHLNFSSIEARPIAELFVFESFNGDNIVCGIASDLAGNWSSEIFSSKNALVDIQTSGTWKEFNLGENAPARASGAIATLNDKTYVFGGLLTSSNTPSNDFYRYDPSIGTNGTWKKLTPTGGPPVARQDAMLAAHGGKLILTGGWNNATMTCYSDLWEYTPATDGGDGTWTQVTANTSIIVAAGVLASLGNELYLFGGRKYCSPTTQYNTMRKWSSTTNTFSAITTTGSTSVRYGSAFGIDGSKLYIFGGYNGSTWITAPAVYDASQGTNGTWTALPTDGMPGARIFPMGAVFENDFYVFGGSELPSPYNTVNTLFRFKASTQTWSQLSIPDPPIARHRAHMTADNKGVFLYGGTKTYNGVDRLEDSFRLEKANASDDGLTQWTRLGFSLNSDSQFLTKIGNDIFFLSNQSAKFNPMTGQFKSLRSQNAPSNVTFLSDRTAAVATSSKAYLVGGTTAGVHDYTVREFDPAGAIGEGSWSVITPTNALKPSAHFAFGSGIIDERYILIFGGSLTGGTLLNELWIFDLVDRTWTQKNPAGMPPPQQVVNYWVSEDKFYIYSGVDSMGYFIEEFYSYELDNQEGVWTDLNATSLNGLSFRGYGWMIPFQSTFASLGGFLEPNSIFTGTNEILIYDKVQNQWNPISIDGINVSTEAMYRNAIEWRGQIYIVGIQEPNATFSPRVLRYRP